MVKCLRHTTLVCENGLVFSEKKGIVCIPCQKHPRSWNVVFSEDRSIGLRLKRFACERRHFIPRHQNIRACAKSHVPISVIDYLLCIQFDLSLGFNRFGSILFRQEDIGIPQGSLLSHAEADLVLIITEESNKNVFVAESRRWYKLFMRWVDDGWYAITVVANFSGFSCEAVARITGVVRFWVDLEFQKNHDAHVGGTSLSLKIEDVAVFFFCGLSHVLERQTIMYGAVFR